MLPIPVCCDMHSETRIAYGSVVLRQGRSLPFWLNQARSSSSTPLSVEQPAAAREPEDRSCEQPCEQLSRSVIDLFDRALASHCAVVAVYARDMAAELRLSEDDQNLVYCAALVHDLGRIGVF